MQLGTTKMPKISFSEWRPRSSRAVLSSKRAIGDCGKSPSVRLMLFRQKNENACRIQADKSSIWLASEIDQMRLCVRPASSLTGGDGGTISPLIINMFLIPE